MSLNPMSYPLWRRLLPGASVGLVLGIAIGVVTYALFFDQGTRARWERALFAGVQGGVTAVIATLFTYFLVNRHLRRREREADLLVAAHLAEVTARLEDLMRTYPEPHEEARDTEVLAWLRSLRGDGKEARLKTSRAGLQDILFRLRGIPTLYRSALSDLDGVEVLISRVTSLLGACSPRMARSIPRLCDQLAFDLREARETLLRADRACDELERITRHGAGRVESDEVLQVLERVALGASCLYEELGSDFSEFVSGPLQVCRERTWPTWAVKELESTLHSLRELSAGNEQDPKCPSGRQG